jgi:DNA-binding NarL/FixJ family response regulator
MKRITVLLADDNTIIRREFRKLLELENDLEVVGEAKNGREAVVMAKKLCPAIILMDVAMPLLNGLQASRLILKAAPTSKILLFSADRDDVYVEAARNSGALGYLIMQSSVATVRKAIRQIHNGNVFFSPSISGRLPKRKRKR